MYLSHRAYIIEHMYSQAHVSACWHLMNEYNHVFLKLSSLIYNKAKYATIDNVIYDAYTFWILCIILKGTL